MKVNVLPENQPLYIEDLSFSYDGADWDYVLDHINLTIPQHKVTAIVGASILVLYWPLLRILPGRRMCFG